MWKVLFRLQLFNYNYNYCLLLSIVSIKILKPNISEMDLYLLKVARVLKPGT